MTHHRSLLLGSCCCARLRTSLCAGRRGRPHGGRGHERLSSSPPKPVPAAGAQSGALQSTAKCCSRAQLRTDISTVAAEPAAALLVQSRFQAFSNAPEYTLLVSTGDKYMHSPEHAVFGSETLQMKLPDTLGGTTCMHSQQAALPAQSKQLGSCPRSWEALRPTLKGSCLSRARRPQGGGMLAACGCSAGVAVAGCRHPLSHVLQQLACSGKRLTGCCLSHHQ